MPNLKMNFDEDNQLMMSVAPPCRVDDWVLDVMIEVQSGGFSGKYSAFIFEQELTHLRDELKRVYKNLSGSLRFETLGFAGSEKPLEFEITGNGRGQFDVVGVARHNDNCLVFTIDFDQTCIPQMVRELDEIIESP